MNHNGPIVLGLQLLKALISSSSQSFAPKYNFLQMGKTKHSQASSKRKKWDTIFNGLVKMLKSQQEQLETLVKQRKILEDRIKMQHDRWVSDIRLYEDYVSQVSPKFC